MPKERMLMRHVRDCVRLKNAGMSMREIARRVGVRPMRHLVMPQSVVRHPPDSFWIDRTNGQVPFLGKLDRGRRTDI